jgi:ankyrin repeat protein
VNGNDDCIEVLLSAGASPHVSDNKGHSALHLACQKGHLEAVKLMIRKK